MKVNVIMSCRSDSTLLQYWPVISKIWKKNNYNPILGVLGLLSEKKLKFLENFGNIYNFPIVNKINEKVQEQIIKFYIPYFLEKNDIVIFSDLRLILLNNEWIKITQNKINNNIIIPWPELKSEYLMGHVYSINNLFNFKKFDYNTWIEYLVIESFNFIDKDGLITSKNFSENSFLFNIVNIMDESIKISLIGRDDIYFNDENSYGISKRTEWDYWNKLDIDSDIDVIGPNNLFLNYQKIKPLFEVLGVASDFSLNLQKFMEIFKN